MLALASACLVVRFDDVIEARRVVAVDGQRDDGVWELTVEQ